MRITLLPLSAFVFTSAAVPALAGIPASTTDPVTIMRAVEDRDPGNRVLSRGVLAVMPKRGRKVSYQMRVMRTRDARKSGRRSDERGLLMFERPADARNTGLLIVDYTNPNKADDQWLYLPSVKRTTRITGASKSDGFMGSDFSYFDMGRIHAGNWKWKLEKSSTRVGSESCWLLSGVAKDAGVIKRTGYAKIKVWVSKGKLMVVQKQAWVSKGKKMKLFRNGKFKKVSGVWFATEAGAQTLEGRKPVSTSFIRSSSIEVNSNSVRSSDFTVKRLEQGL